MTADDTAAIAAVAALADDQRQRLYTFIRGAGSPVTRDQAAAAAGISRKLAAFHLDKLAAAGLLRTSSARPGGLRRPGRAAKTYQPADGGIEVTIPPRRLAFLAGILLDAVLAGTGQADARRAAFTVAAARGRKLGAAERRHARPGRLGAERALTLTRGFAERSGFEPAPAGPGAVVLRNCPYQPLAAEEPALVCGINHAFLTGFLDGLGAATVAAVLNPRPGRCCVELRAVRAPGPPAGGRAR